MNIRITRELLDDWNMRIGMGHDVSVEIPDALAEIEALIIERDLNVRQADASAELIKGLRTEITKRDKRIAELEEMDGLLCADCMDTGWLENRVEGKYPCTCVSETEPYQILVQQNSEQASEIARLNAVIAKCSLTLDGMKAWFAAEENHEGTTFYGRVEMCNLVQIQTAEALAAIKEIDHALQDK